MAKRAAYVFWFFLLASAPARADAADLDGTLWMYEHENGSRHYVAFDRNYHYLNSSLADEYDDASWLQSLFPYFSHHNRDGSISYRSTHAAPAAWAINWGRLDTDDGTGSFNAAGMLCSIFIFNHNEPYQLVSADWHPPSRPAGMAPAGQDMFIPALLSVFFGQ